MGYITNSERMNAAYAINSNLKDLKSSKENIEAKVSQLAKSVTKAKSNPLTWAEGLFFFLGTGRTFKSVMKEAQLAQNSSSNKTNAVAHQTIGTVSTSEKFKEFEGKSPVEIADMIKETANQPMEGLINKGYDMALAQAVNAVNYFKGQRNDELTDLLKTFKGTYVKGVNGVAMQLLNESTIDSIRDSSIKHAKSSGSTHLVMLQGFPRGPNVLTDAQIQEIKDVRTPDLPKMEENDFFGKSPSEAIEMLRNSINAREDMVVATEEFKSRGDNAKGLHQFLALSMKTASYDNKSNSFGTLFENAKEKLSNLGIKENIKTAERMNNAERALGGSRELPSKTKDDFDIRGNG